MDDEQEEEVTRPGDRFNWRLEASIRPYIRRQGAPRPCTEYRMRLPPLGPTSSGWGQSRGRRNTRASRAPFFVGLPWLLLHKLRSEPRTEPARPLMKLVPCNAHTHAHTKPADALADRTRIFDSAFFDADCLRADVNVSPEVSAAY